VSKISAKVEKKILTLKQLPKIVLGLKNNNKKVISTNGVFDILHPGHTAYLKQARALGDALIVAINSDSSTSKIKGEMRPINKAQDRAKVLSALSSVDYIVIFNEPDPRKILSIIAPYRHVKGGDYKIAEILEREVVEKNGGKIILIKANKKHSTSNTIKTILEKYKKSASIKK
jgi:rfaE bifunctional protein nucleotidyltransferase chain/domain